LSERLRQKEQEVNALWSQVQALKAQLGAITASRTYRLANVMKKMGHTLTPPYSRRAALLRLVLRALRLLRREGLSGAGRKVLCKGGGIFQRHPGRKIGPKPAMGKSNGIACRPNLVSVVLPVYNQANLLVAAIESVLHQDHPLFELILVNDGSNDDIEAVLQQYYLHPRIRILTQANQKLPMALNNGFELASGEFWTWTSADNLMEPDQLSRLVDFLRRHPEADMVYANYLAIDDRGQPLADPSWRPQNRRPAGSPVIRLPHSTRTLNSVQDNFIGPCFLFRGQVGRVLGEYDPQLLGVEDYDYWMRMNRLFNIQHLDSADLLYRYRVHDNTLSAHARELGIYERASRLMAYEAERAAFYQVPWLICVDASVAEALQSVACRPHRVSLWHPGQALFKEPTRRLLFASAATLGKLTSAEAAGFDVVAAWIDGHASAAYEAGPALRQRPGLCLTTSKDLAARVALGHERVLTVATAAEGLPLALAFANRDTFYRRRRRPESPSRRPAAMYRPAKLPLRILVQLDRFGQGGLEQVVLDLLSGLRQAGARVVLLVIEETDLPPLLAGQADHIAKLNGNDPEAAYRALLLREKIDLVSSHYCLFGAGIAHDLGVPFVQTVQNTYVWLTPAQLEAHRQADPFTTAYICVSHEVARYSDLRLGLCVDKMLVLANGVASDRFQPTARPESRARLRCEYAIPREAFVFLNVASIYPPKAQRCAVRALRQVHDAGHDAWLLFLGGIFDSAYQKSLLEDIERLHVGERVVFAGRREDVAAFLGAADAFLLPSFWEGCSLALAEAVLAGLPAVISRVGSAADFAGIEGVTLLDPPFASIVDLDHHSLGQLLHGDHRDFVERLARAMIATRLRPVRPVLDAAQRRALDRDGIIASYYRLFGWLAQGGGPAACRGWLRRAALLQTQAAGETSPARAVA